MNPIAFGTEVVHTRLRIGDVFVHSGLRYVVASVNLSNAHCVPVPGQRRTVEVDDRFAEEKKTFTVPAGRNISVSSNSEVEFVARLGKEWRDRLAELPPK